MLQADQQLERIHQKIQQLLKQQENLNRMNIELRQEVSGLKKQREQQLESIDELQQQLAVLKAAKSELSEEEKKAFEKRLGQYIREIDRCITLLSE
jgi:chromosome segregation ATPase